MTDEMLQRLVGALLQSAGETVHRHAGNLVADPQVFMTVAFAAQSGVATPVAVFPGPLPQGGAMAVIATSALKVAELATSECDCVSCQKLLPVIRTAHKAMSEALGAKGQRISVGEPLPPKAGGLH